MPGAEAEVLKTCSLTELIERARALSAHDAESDQRWKVVWELRQRDPEAVMAIATSLGRSENFRDRELAADMMVCGWHAEDHLRYPRKGEAIGQLTQMLNDPAAEVVASAVYSLSRLDETELLINDGEMLARHASPFVRQAWAASVNSDDPASETTGYLIELSRDVDNEVRDWATFSLGTQSDADSSDIRAALAERLADDDEETRLEAMVGLARRQDRRALPMVLAELESDEVAKSAIEAAGGLALPELVAPLQAVREWWRDAEWVDEAIARCHGRGDPKRNWLWVIEPSEAKSS